MFRKQNSLKIFNFTKNYYFTIGTTVRNNKIALSVSFMTFTKYWAITKPLQLKKYHSPLVQLYLDTKPVKYLYKRVTAWISIEITCEFDLWVP